MLCLMLGIMLSINVSHSNLSFKPTKGIHMALGTGITIFGRLYEYHCDLFSGRVRRDGAGEGMSR